MKLTIVFLIGGLLQVHAKGISQQVTLSGKDIPVQTVFSAVEKQTGYSVVGNKSILRNAKPVSINVTNMDLRPFLELVLKDQPFKYEISDKTIILSNKVKSPGLSPRLVSDTPPITGVVTNAEGQPLAGASVKIKGTHIGTITDSDGKFILDATPGQTLIISYVGYSDIEISATEGNKVIKLKSNNNPLDEVVFKGYYNDSKRLNTGNVSKIGAQDIEKQPVSNPLEALIGRMPGVNIQQNSGVPGTALRVSIRGTNSLRADGNDPLYVIDGVPFSSQSLTSSSIGGSIIPGSSPLNSINASDIQSIEVLKDADATAIYGSRGSNGVILISTKKGKAGKTTLDINIYSGNGEISKKMKFLDTRQYLEMRNEAFKNDGTTPSLNNFPPDHDLLTWDTIRYTDWQEALIGGTANTTNMQASVSGGNANTQFLIGGGFFKQTSVFPGDFNYNKGSAHLNINHASTNQKFRINASVNYATDINNLPSVDLTQKITLPPNAPALYDEDGELNWENGTWENPLSKIMQPYRAKTNNLIANTVVSYQVIPGLYLKSSLGYTNIRLEEKALYTIRGQNPANAPLGSNDFGNNTIETWIAEPQVEYTKDFKRHKLTLLGGSTFQENLQNAQRLGGSGYTNDALIENLQIAPNKNNSSSYRQYRYNAFFGRVNYSLDNKYIINLTGRRDGSSRFGPDKRFSNFGATGVAWIFSNESRIKDFSWLSFGKLRASYGTTGSDQIPDYGYLDTYLAAQPYQGGISLVPSRLVNLDFAWESNRKLEIGLALGFLQDRLYIEGSWYRNRSSNQLVGYALPDITGFPDVQYNLPASVQNTGLEIEARSINFTSKHFSWSTSANVTFPRNKLLAYPNIEGSSYNSSYSIGSSLYTFKAFHYLGVDPSTGVYIFEDIDKNGTTADNPGDRQTSREITSKFFGGLQNNITFKRFQFDFFIQFVKQTRQSPFNSYALPGTSSNQPVEVLDRWQKPGDDAQFQKFTQAFNDATIAYFNLIGIGDNFVDASFVRLKNISLSWSLPDKWLQSIKFSNACLYVQGQNLVTFTDFVGDPETIGSFSLPTLKILTGGIRFSF